MAGHYSGDVLYRHDLHTFIRIEADEDVFAHGIGLQLFFVLIETGDGDEFGVQFVTIDMGGEVVLSPGEGGECHAR